MKNIFFPFSNLKAFFARRKEKKQAQRGISTAGLLGVAAVAATSVLAVTGQVTQYAKTQQSMSKANQGKAINEAAIDFVAQRILKGAVNFEAPYKFKVVSTEAMVRWKLQDQKGVFKYLGCADGIEQAEISGLIAQASAVFPNASCPPNQTPILVTVTLGDKNAQGQVQVGAVSVPTGSQNNLKDITVNARAVSVLSTKPNAPQTLLDKRIKISKSNGVVDNEDFHAENLGKPDLCFFMNTTPQIDQELVSGNRSARNLDMTMLVPKKDPGPSASGKSVISQASFGAAINVSSLSTTTTIYDNAINLRNALHQYFKQNNLRGAVIYSSQDNGSGTAATFAGVAPQTGGGSQEYGRPRFHYFLGHNSGGHYTIGNSTLENGGWPSTGFSKDKIKDLAEGCSTSIAGRMTLPPNGAQPDFCTRVDLPFKTFKASLTAQCTQAVQHVPMVAYQVQVSEQKPVQVAVQVQVPVQVTRNVYDPNKARDCALSRINHAQIALGMFGGMTGDPTFHWKLINYLGTPYNEIRDHGCSWSPINKMGVVYNEVAGSALALNNINGAQRACGMFSANDAGQVCNWQDRRQCALTFINQAQQNLGMWDPARNGDPNWWLYVAQLGDAYNMVRDRNCSWDPINAMGTVYNEIRFVDVATVTADINIAQRACGMFSQDDAAAVCNMQGTVTEYQTQTQYQTQMQTVWHTETRYNPGFGTPVRERDQIVCDPQWPDLVYNMATLNDVPIQYYAAMINLDEIKLHEAFSMRPELKAPYQQVINFVVGKIAANGGQISGDSQVDKPGQVLNITNPQAPATVVYKSTDLSKQDFTVYALQGIPEQKLPPQYDTMTSRCVYVAYFNSTDPHNCSFKVLGGESANWVCRNNDGCFAQDTYIRMADGTEKLIANIQKGEMVFNPRTGKAAKIAFLTQGPEPSALYSVGFGNRIVHVTKTHPFYTPNGLVEAQQLLKGQLVLDQDNTFKPIEIVEIGQREAEDPVVFNLKLEGQVEEDHFVLANGVVTGDLWAQQYLESLQKK